jgi:hypothetical protein
MAPTKESGDEGEEAMSEVNVAALLNLANRWRAQAKLDRDWAEVTASPERKAEHAMAAHVWDRAADEMEKHLPPVREPTTSTAAQKENEETKPEGT